MGKHSYFVGAAALAALLSSSVAQAALIDFESDTAPAISASEFTLATGNGVYVSRGDSKAFGVNAIKAGNADSNAIYAGTSAGFSNNGAFSLVQGQTFSESIYFRFSKTNVVTASAQRLIQLGLSTNAGGIANFFTQGSVLTTRINYSGGVYSGTTYPGTFQLQTISIGSGNTTSANNSTTFTLVDGDIYKFDTNLTYTDSTTGLFTISSALNDYGINGLTAPATPTAAVVGETITNAAFIGDLSNLFTGLRSISSTGAIAFDNFSATNGGDVALPEPASVALAGAALGATLLRKPKR